MSMYNDNLRVYDEQAYIIGKFDGRRDGARDLQRGVRMVVRGDSRYLQGYRIGYREAQEGVCASS